MKRLIRNGLLIDGLGSAPKKSDLLIDRNKIAAVEDTLSIAADEIMDAAGKIVSPAFIDMHRHFDAKALSSRSKEVELRQGIATTIVGNCGFSMAPLFGRYAGEKHENDIPILGNYPIQENLTFSKYMDALESTPQALNIAAMIGLGAVRISLNGFSDQPLTSNQLANGRSMIQEALDSGACGVSAGIMYLPEFYTTRDEYLALLNPLKGGRKPFVTHIRGEGDSMVESVREVIEIAKRVECPLEISHFKSCGMKNWNKDIYRAIELIENERAHGMDITVDFYPYIGGSTGLTTMLPPAFVKGDMPNALKRLGTSSGIEEFRTASRIGYDDWDNYALTLGWDRILISSAEGENRKFIGMSVPEAAETFGFDDPEALAAHLMHTENGRTAIINFSMDQKDVDTIANLPYSILISDAIYADTDTPHPRMFGAFPHFIEDYVVNRHVLSLESAIQKMTSMPAKRMQLQNRGILSVGNYADIVIFDPSAIHSAATFTSSSHLGEGISALLINGEWAVKDDFVFPSSHGNLLRI